jgi:hypothetical protein
MGGEELGAHTVFGSVLMPALEHALAAGDLGAILRICAFLEEVAEAAEEDLSLKGLLQVEVGEWLGGAANEACLAPWLGMKTKRICGYVPGLATQRIALRAEENKRSLTANFFFYDSTAKKINPACKVGFSVNQHRYGL